MIIIIEVLAIKSLIFYLITFNHLVTLIFIFLKSIFTLIKISIIVIIINSVAIYFLYRLLIFQ